MVAHFAPLTPIKYLWDFLSSSKIVQNRFSSTYVSYDNEMLYMYDIRVLHWLVYL